MDLSNLGNGINAINFDDEDEPKKEKVKEKKKKTKDAAEDEISGGNAKLIHIRVQQRNGRKCITTVQGLDSQLDLKKILKAIKKAECCNGSARPTPPFDRLLARRHRRVRKASRLAALPKNWSALDRGRRPARSRHAQLSWKTRRWARCSSSRATSATPSPSSSPRMVRHGVPLLKPVAPAARDARPHAGGAARLHAC